MVVSSDDILSLDRVPQSLLVIGAGAVGVEFASIYLAFGSKVVLVEREPRLVPIEDREISEALLRAFTRQGMEILRRRLDPERARGGRRRLDRGEGPGRGRWSVSHRARSHGGGTKAQHRGLGLEAVGVTLERGFVKVNERMQTSVPGSTRSGTSSRPRARARGLARGRASRWRRSRGRVPHPVNYSAIPNCTYCHPQIASVGPDRGPGARVEGVAVKVGKFPFIANSKASILGQGDGFVKAVADATSGEILGVHIIGVQATEQIAESVVARHFEATALELAEVVHAHPTLAEATMEAMFATDGRADPFLTTAGARPARSGNRSVPTRG